MKSKKTVFIVLLGAVGIVILGYVVSSFSAKRMSYETPPESILASSGSTSPNTLSATDSDKDGLADWEEILWKTDIKNPDSDSDGISDGDEVQKNRDPSVEGAGNLKTTPSENPSMTEKLARDVIASYLQLKNGGTGGDIETVLSKNSVSISAPRYKVADLHSVPDSSSAITAYAKDLATIVGTYITAEQKNELELFQASLETEDRALIQLVADRAEGYRKAVKELVAINVPKSGLSIHSDFVNAFSLLAETTHALSLIYTDPLTAVTGLEQYQSVSLLFAKQINDLNLYLQSKASL